MVGGHALTRWHGRRCSNLCALDFAEDQRALEHRCRCRAIALAERMLVIEVKGCRALRPSLRLVL